MRPSAVSILLAIFAACGAAHAQATTSASGDSPSPTTTLVAPEQHPSGKLQWDGLPIVATDGLAYASLAIALSSRSTAAGTVPVGLGLFVLGGPIVHAAHRQWGSLGMSLATRIIFPLVGDGVLVSGCHEGDCAQEAVTGLAIGMGVATVLDLAALSWERVPDHEQPSVQPVMSLGKDHAWLGASGRF